MKATNVICVSRFTTSTFQFEKKWVRDMFHRSSSSLTTKWYIPVDGVLLNSPQNITGMPGCRSHETSLMWAKTTAIWTREMLLPFGCQQRWVLAAHILLEESFVDWRTETWRTEDLWSTLSCADRYKTSFSSSSLWSVLDSGASWKEMSCWLGRVNLVFR